MRGIRILTYSNSHKINEIIGTLKNRLENIQDIDGETWNASLNLIYSNIEKQIVYYMSNDSEFVSVKSTNEVAILDSATFPVLLEQLKCIKRRQIFNINGTKFRINDFIIHLGTMMSGTGPCGVVLLIECLCLSSTLFIDRFIDKIMTPVPLLREFRKHKESSIVSALSDGFL